LRTLTDVLVFDRHPGEGRDPAFALFRHTTVICTKGWIPAFAGMTNEKAGNRAIIRPYSIIASTT
jgi:hypothetical protein